MIVFQEKKFKWTGKMSKWVLMTEKLNFKRYSEFS